MIFKEGTDRIVKLVYNTGNTKKIYSDTTIEKVIGFPSVNTADSGKFLEIGSDGKLTFTDLQEGTSTKVSGLMSGKDGKIVPVPLNDTIIDSAGAITSSAIYNEYQENRTSESADTYINTIEIPEDAVEGKLKFTAQSTLVKQMIQNPKFKNYNQYWDFIDSNINTFNYDYVNDVTTLLFSAYAKDGHVQQSVNGYYGLYLVVASYATDSSDVIPFASGNVSPDDYIRDVHPGDGDFHTIYYIFYGSVDSVGIKDTRESDWSTISVKYINIFDLHQMGYNVTAEPTPDYLRPFFIKLKNQIKTNINTGVFYATSLMAYTYGINYLKDSFNIPYTFKGKTIYKQKIYLPTGKYVFYPITSSEYQMITANFMGNRGNTTIAYSSSQPASEVNNILEVTDQNNVISLDILAACKDTSSTPKYISFILIPYDKRDLYDPDNFDASKFEYFYNEAYIPELGLSLSANNSLDLNSGKLTTNVKSKVLTEDDIAGYYRNASISDDIIGVFIKKPLDYMYYNKTTYNEIAVYCDSLFVNYDENNFQNFYYNTTTFTSEQEAIDFIVGRTMYYVTATPTITDINSIINVKPNTTVYFEPMYKFTAKPVNHVITTPNTDAIYNIVTVISVTNVITGEAITVNANTTNTITISSDASDDVYYEVLYKYTGNTSIIPMSYSYGKNTRYQLNDMKSSISKQTVKIADLQNYIQYNITPLNNKFLDHMNDSDVHVTLDDKTMWNDKQDALTFDSTPLLTSNNPVTSDGIKKELNKKSDIVNVVPYENATADVNLGVRSITAHQYNGNGEKLLFTDTNNHFTSDEIGSGLVQLGDEIHTAQNSIVEVSTTMQSLFSQFPVRFYKTSIEDMNAITSMKPGDLCYVIDFVQSITTLYTYDTADMDNDNINPEWLPIGVMQFELMRKEDLLAILQLATVAVSGKYSDLTGTPDRYEAFITLEENTSDNTVTWDYSLSDKAKVTLNDNPCALIVTNVSSGSIGIIECYGSYYLAVDGKTSADFDYLIANTDQHWLYMFMYDGTTFSWTRTVVTNE